VAIAVIAGCGQASGGDSVIHPATFPGDGQGAGGTGTAAKMPSPADATRVVRELWTQRENTIGRNDADGFGEMEAGAAQAIDSSYVQFVICGCNTPKAEHTLLRVLPIIPRTSANGSFMAEVQTLNTTTGERPWYIIGMTREAGAWKIGFITFGWCKKQPPLRLPKTVNGYMPPLTAATRKRIQQLAAADVKVSMRAGTHTKTGYGADVRTTTIVRPGEGLFGIDLRNGRVLGCYTVHTLDTYSMAGGLNQDSGQHNWGPKLKPGVYGKILTDTAHSVCDSGKPGAVYRVAQYDLQQVAASGTRLTASA
jgi:hypothetical protein